MAKQTVKSFVKLKKQARNKCDYKVVMSCGHTRYVRDKPKKGQAVQCTQGSCKYIFP
jgi:hypothetical protein